MGDIIELVAVMMGLSVPLSIIISIYKYKAKRLVLKNLSTEERAVLLELKSENAELKRRLGNLEYIISGSEQDALGPVDSELDEIVTKKELNAAQRLELLAKKHDQDI